MLALQIPLQLWYPPLAARARSRESRVARGQAMTDQTAQIESLFLQWGPMVLRRARIILGNDADAEEAMSDVFLKVFDAYEHFEGRSQISTWLYRMTTNLCLNRLRNQTRRRELRELHLSENVAIGGQPDRVLAREILQKVPDPDWAKAAVYVYVDGMTHPEAAATLGVSTRTIGNYLKKIKTWANAQEQQAYGVRTRNAQETGT